MLNIEDSPLFCLDLPTSSVPAVTGLPPQSPRRKNNDVAADEPEDEISQLKQQLKATLAVLSSDGAKENSVQNPNSKTSHSQEVIIG